MADNGWTPVDAGASSFGDWTPVPQQQTDFTPAGFYNQYGDAINSIAGQLNVDPHVIAGQLGLETGYGKSVIPGTNNLGNIKALDGKGVRAVDNQTGSNDAYKQYASPTDFANAYVDLISRKYPGAVGAKDATAYATALKNGGYAEDKNYINKVSGAAKLMSGALAGMTSAATASAGLRPGSASSADISDVDALIKQYGSSKPAGQSASSQPDDDVASLIKQYGDAPAPGVVTTTTNPAAMGLRDAVYGAIHTPAKWLSSAADFVAPDSDFAKGMRQGVTDLEATDRDQQRAYNQVEHSTGAKFVRGATDIAGMAATNPIYGSRALPVIAQSAYWGAYNDPDNPLLGGVIGTGAGALGVGAGKAVGAGYNKAKDWITGSSKAAAQAVEDGWSKAGDAVGGMFSQEERLMAGRVSDKINSTVEGTGQDALAVADQLAAGKSAVPGYQQTAAEVTQNPVVQGLQQGLDNSSVNAGLTARKASNAEANTAYLQGLGGDDATLSRLGQQAEQHAAAGNQELGAVTSQVPFDTPAMQGALYRGNTAAANDGSNVIQQVLDQPSQDAIIRWNGLAGSAQKTAQLELERQAATAPLYQQVFDGGGPVFHIEGDLASMLETDGLRQAIREIGVNKRNARIAEPVIQAGADGNFINANDLNQARIALDARIKQITTDTTSAQKNQIAPLTRLRNDLNGFLEQSVPGLAEANAVYRGFADRITESKFLTHPDMVDAFGRRQVSLSKLDALIERIESGMANNNPLDKAKTVSIDKLGELRALRQQLSEQINRHNAVGLQGDGYNYLRQGAAGKPDAEAQLRQYLEQNSPSYQNFYATQEELARQQNFRTVLDKIDSRADGNVNWHDVKNLGTQADHFTPEQLQGMGHVRDNIQNVNNMVPTVRGSNTAANLAARHGLDEIAAGTAPSGLKGAIADYTPALLRSFLGSKAAVAGHAVGGPVGAVIADIAADKLGSSIGTKAAAKLGSKTEQRLAQEMFDNKRALENLLLDPQRLAAALKVTHENAQDAEKALGLLTEASKRNGAIGGRLGAWLGDATNRDFLKR